MFQLGSLVVLCGLLTGTSAQNSEFIQKLKVQEFTQDPALQHRNIKAKLSIPSNPRDFKRFNFSLFMNNRRDIFSGQRKRDLQAGLSSNDNGTEMKMPLMVDSSVYLQNATMDSVMVRESTSLTKRVSLPMEKQIFEMSDAPLKLLTQDILTDLLMEENQSISR
ncbi:uncharacterized protein LOC143272784 [Peromyscus maniculatus bairdii]|uniref:uncharacterized protein LOC143272784 n=1 Tax=Peromyscus maniculatus bairdii TaxID=230844 RepID=UPI003FD1E0AE